MGDKADAPSTKRPHPFEVRRREDRVADVKRPNQLQKIKTANVSEGNGVVTGLPQAPSRQRRQFLHPYDGYARRGHITVIIRAGSDSGKVKYRPVYGAGVNMWNQDALLQLKETLPHSRQ